LTAIYSGTYRIGPEPPVMPVSCALSGLQRTLDAAYVTFVAILARCKIQPDPASSSEIQVDTIQISIEAR
jgi:hypothetical protein